MHTEPEYHNSFALEEIAAKVASENKTLEFLNLTDELDRLIDEHAAVQGASQDNAQSSGKIASDCVPHFAYRLLTFQHICEPDRDRKRKESQDSVQGQIRIGCETE